MASAGVLQRDTRAARLPRPSLRRTRRALAIAVVVLASLAGAYGALATVTQTRELSTGEIRLSVSPGHRGALDVYVPLVDWGARFDREGRLDGVAQTLPNTNLFVAMYVRREAVLSSQIEGTQTTLEDLLTFELDPGGREVPRDVGEVVNYVRAMNHGLARLATLPLSLRLIRELHQQLMTGV